MMHGGNNGLRVILFLITFLVIGITAQASTNKTLSFGKLLATKTIAATVTAYTPAPRENGGRGRKSGTAIGTAIRPGIVAVSRDLLHSGWDFGDKVHIEGLGVFLIEDTMHQRFHRTIDVAVPNLAAARRIGIQRQIEVTLLEHAPRPRG
jgi:3D (Asp-Asp-Asp) domain-containing protein